jgi:hypothetical protein
MLKTYTMFLTVQRNGFNLCIYDFGYQRPPLRSSKTTVMLIFIPDSNFTTDAAVLAVATEKWTPLK